MPGGKQSRKRRRRKPRQEGIQTATQWHRLPLDLAHERASEELRAALIDEPNESRRSFFQRFANAGPLDQAVAWEALRQYLTVLEEQLRTIIERHSIFYWLHLYRRIGVALHRDHAGADDPGTIAWVRQIMETAFTKYGSLEQHNDIALTSSMRRTEIWGGLFVEALAVRGIDDEQLLLDGLERNPQFAPRAFSPADIVDLYRAEGLAHEYWLTTARMRGVGKGEFLSVTDRGVEMQRLPALNRLIESYDERIARSEFNTSMVGSSFFSDHDSTLRALVTAYNTARAPIPDYGRYRLPLWPDRFNFQVGIVDVDAFLAAHWFLGNAFFESKGFHLSSLCGVLSALPFHNMYLHGHSDDAVGGQLFQLHQRAYFLTCSYESYASDLEALTHAMVGRERSALLRDEFERVLKFLTLTPNKQAAVGLWSRGPRFTFVPHGPNLMVVDMLPTTSILGNAFFRVSANQQAKGTTFEDNFRALVERSGIELLPERRLRASGTERELDVGIRDGTTLYLCECRAMERPLDVEIGRTKTISRRNNDLDEKVTQALSLAEFIEENPRGDNYDYSWAEELVPIVVSPFCEWVWSLSSRLWIDEAIPRILSANEALELIRSRKEMRTKRRS